MSEAKSVKVVMVGESGAGKSALLRRFVEGSFGDDYHATIGIDFRHKTVDLPSGALIRLQLWDTAGQERFRQLAPSYIRDAAVILLVFDLSQDLAVQHLVRWKQIVERDRGPEIPIVVVGNKCDINSRKASVDVKHAVKDLGDFYIETSAKTGKNVNELFQRVASMPFTERNRGTIVHLEKTNPDSRRFCSC